MHRIMRILPSLAASSALGWAGTAYSAQLTVNFSQTTATPISPWLVLAMTFAIMLAALAMYRRNGTQRFFLFGAGLVVAASALMVEKDSWAASILLTPPSPWQVTFNCGNAGIDNTYSSGVAGGTIVITSVVYDNTSAHGTGVNGGITTNTCAPGTVLIGANSCHIVTSAVDVCPPS